MAENTYKTPRRTSKGRRSFFPSFSWTADRRFHIALGFLLQGVSVFLLLAFVSHLLHGKADQSTVESMGGLGIRVAGGRIHNWLGLLGAASGHYFLFRWMGVAAFLLLPPLFFMGYYSVYGVLPGGIRLQKMTLSAIFCILWVNVALGYADLIFPGSLWLEMLVGGMGIEVAVFFHGLMGGGTVLFLLVGLAIFLIYFLDMTALPALFSGPWMASRPQALLEAHDVVAAEPPVAHTPVEPVSMSTDGEPSSPISLSTTVAASVTEALPAAEEVASSGPQFTVVAQQTEEVAVDKLDNYDPKLDLSAYHYPTLDLLAEHAQAKVAVSQEELSQNKDRIVETLTNFKIGISSIKATIGPTVTLYEIVPAAGIKISRIKNLEDDIALSLSALGIRIIAPIPGKGTIGIEVPNKHREMVPLRAVLGTERFMKSEMELPVIMGRTIANETYVADLAKMPHLLIAGATGQGKSVGLNVVLTSLIYKKHPSQLKLVLVDPKKVELSLYNKLERHFLAKLPGDDESIITETKKVIHTLNSLCMEMDQRYELLKEAGVRNIKEYNERFVKRRLNPEQGHRFLPYIVLVIDEFADMMMTAGKEIETPIARLAQLARAIGIHLVLATQRPSVNVITGIIKANFPVRISYKVTSRIDSRTILDTGGAEQLVGRGDMLLSINSEAIRLQCPFLDTEEVAGVCDYIGAQRGYSMAYQLPAYEDELGERGNVELGEQDAMFEEAARLIVAHQQGSTSLIQRKLKLGYNRAGRLIDQLEAAGIVGAFEGSKAREVLVKDEHSLALILKGMEA